MLDVNMLGTVNTVAAFLALIRGVHGRRRIALTASPAVLFPGARLGACTTGKLAANRRYIVSHGRYQAELVERTNDILAALDRAQD